tara:strand:+ start:354 stop:1583 length:1230 start_codon:yes stop_codon:yes gene_type:complete
MKKRFITLSAATLAVAGAQAADGKIWEVSATLKGFYDDNVTTAPNNEVESGGIEFSPALSLNYGDGTDLDISAGYAYGLRWYDDRPTDDQDHGHELGLSLNKAFTDTSRLSLSESYVVAQEPALLDGGTPLRLEGDNTRNTFQAGYKRILSGKTGLELGYGNSLFDYDDRTFSSLLDRQVNSFSVDGFHYLDEQTELVVGYKFAATDFDGPKVSGSNTALAFDPDARDNDSHFAYVGLSRTLNAQLAVEGLVGIQSADFDNADRMPDVVTDDDPSSPFADVRFTWSYAEDSSVVGGVMMLRTATDLRAADQETTAIYAQLRHRFTDLSPDLYGTITGRYQSSELNGGGAGVDGKDEELNLFGVGLSYNISESMWAELSYNFDELQSDVRVYGDRSFDRNYVSIGIGARY